MLARSRPAEETFVSDQTVEQEPPIASAIVAYLGPVAPHWEVRTEYGDATMLEEFRQRVLARLLLLPPHDPQFKRNRERVIRDAERERIALSWDPPEVGEPAPPRA